MKAWLKSRRKPEASAANPQRRSAAQRKRQRQRGNRRKRKPRSPSVPAKLLLRPRAPPRNHQPPKRARVRRAARAARRLRAGAAKVKQTWPCSNPKPSVPSALTWSQRKQPTAASTSRRAAATMESTRRRRQAFHRDANAPNSPRDAEADAVVAPPKRRRPTAKTALTVKMKRAKL